MKRFLIICTLFLSSNLIAQSGWQVGINISPAWKLNLHKSKLTTLRSSESGYGFSIGIPVKYWVNDYTSFNTGIDYDFTSFDNITNNQLVSSFRINSLQIPLMFSSSLKGQWYGMYGVGVGYNLSVRDLNLVGGNDVSGLTNRIQPYLGLGLSSFVEKGKGNLEIGVLGRYQLLDIWNKDYPPAESVTSHLLSVDFIFRFYL